ncbi:MAG TPA: LamG-like jellyroll fold domain-containing protein, partial [Verrucomicrobiae bacterium]
AGNGTGQSSPVVLPVSGTYTVRVSYNYQYWGEYRLRVTLGSASWQVEGEDNNNVGQANQPTFTRAGTNQWANVLGYLRYGDPGDVFFLGNLSDGTDARVTYGKPSSSGLSGVLSVLNSSGAVVASATAGTTNLTYTIPAGQGGAYYARIQAGPPGYASTPESALYFDGGYTFVDLGAWSPGAQWTVEARVRPVSLPGGRRTIVGGFAQCLDWGITMQDGRFGIGIKPPGSCSQTVSAPDTVALGQWYHVLATCDGLTARLYVNGQFSASGAVEPNYTGTANGTRIGSEVCCGGNTFPGYIDEVAIWNRPVTGEEVQARLAGPLTGGENGLVGYWRFNEGQGGTTADATAQGRTGTLQNGVAWVSMAPSSAGEPGLLTQYLLNLNLTDTLPPTIVADTLPAEGSSVLGLFDRFSLTFSEDMLATSVNAPSSYELRASGPDGQLDTADDLFWPVAASPAYSAGLTANYRVTSGALPPGRYRFTAKTALQDRSGNPLAAAYARQFEVLQVPGFYTESEPNNTRETATPLPMVSTQPNLISGAGRGFLVDSSDWDYWSFEAQAGDVMILAAETPGNVSGSGLYYTLFSPSGAQLVGVYADSNGLLQNGPRVLTDTGVYTVRVSYNYGYYNEHRLRVSLYRNGLPMEVESNNTLATATPLSYTTNGNTRAAVIGGYTQLSTDLDYFGLGTIEAGKTVFLRTRQPASSPLAPVVSLYNAANAYMPEAGSGRPSDGVAEVRIEQTGGYYALVRAGGNSAGLMSEYLLDVSVLPTTDVVIPNLQVTNIFVPVATGLRSGDPFTFSFAVANVGSLATPVSLWFDRAVLSADTVMDVNDLPLGLYQHNGALQPGQGYSVTNTVNLPDGVSGSFYLIVKADYTDTVNEFLLEGDNETVTENPIVITLADYPDLKIENFNLTGPDGSQTYTVSWSTFNRGTASAPAGFKERVRVRNQTTATTVFDQTYTVGGALAVNASVSRQVNFQANTPGTYLVEVTTDSDQQIYEYDGVSHASAEANTATATFAITQFFTVTLNASPLGAGTLTGAGTYPAGTSVTVTATPVTNQAPYIFQSWTEGGVVRSANPSYTFTLNQNATLTALFGLPGFQLTASNNPPAAGSVVGAGVFPWGSTNTLTAQPAFGYKFSHWTENGLTVGTNVTLTTVLYSNRFFVANYADANLIHVVTTATLPAGLATVSGVGTYANGQSTTISAPLAVTNAPPDYYAFKRFTLNGAVFGTNASLLKTFVTTDPTNMLFVAEYDFVDRTPPTLGPITVTSNTASAIIAWTTGEAASARVEYGLTTAYGFTNSSALVRTSHSFNLTGLTPATLYHFRVRVTDAAGNETVSGDHTFSTLAPPDLVAGAVTVPASAQAGTMVPLVFVITNIGPGAAFGPWQNSVLISPNAGGAGAQSLGAVSFSPGA